MDVVDSHCHASLAWYEPVESLLHQMDRHGVGQAVLIQIRGQTDNSYQEDCRRRFPGRFASVVLVDEGRPDAPQALARLAEAGASGVRLGPDARSPGDDPLAIWRAAAGLGLAVSCLGSARAFADPAFAEVVAAVPQVPVVLEHLGGLQAQGGALRDEATQRAVFGLARFPHVYIKVPGLGEFCQRAVPVQEPFPFERPVPPLLSEAYRTFGARRMMWGSDYPPVAGREGYGNALRLPMAELAEGAGLGPEEQALVFGGVARQVFPVRA